MFNCLRFCLVCVDQVSWCCCCRYNLWRNEQHSTQHNRQIHPTALQQLSVSQFAALSVVIVFYTVVILWTLPISCKLATGNCCFTL